MEILDAPEIRRMERFGALAEEREPRCPVCGAECEWLYLDSHGEAAGCDRCLSRRDARKEAACNRNR